jgi:hypothetical protein
MLRLLLFHLNFVEFIHTFLCDLADVEFIRLFFLCGGKVLPHYDKYWFYESEDPTHL